MTEVFGRIEQVSVRLTPSDAIALTALIQQKVVEAQAFAQIGKGDAPDSIGTNR